MQLLVPKNVVELKKTSHSIYDFTDSMDQMFNLRQKAGFITLYDGLLFMLTEQIASCSQNCEGFEVKINEAIGAQKFLEVVVEEMEKFRNKDSPF